MNLVIGEMFAGGGGVALGARMIGIESAWAVEMDNEIADVYAANLPGCVIRRRVQDVDPRMLDNVDILWASPVCKEFSVANSGGEEGEEEISQAEAICRFLTTLRPRAFVLENVPKYRDSKSLSMIVTTLNLLGYRYDARLLNSADYGVPQTRRRLILRAVRGEAVPELRPTHTSREGSLLDCLQPWNGWFAAIEDLIPTLPESKFAPWQFARLDPLLADTLVGQQYDGPSSDAARQPQQAQALDPAMAVTAALKSKGAMPKAFIVDSAGYPNADGDRVPVIRSAEEPCNTIVANLGRRPMRAFLAGQGENSDIRAQESPAPTIAANHGAGKYRAFLVGGGNTSEQQAAPGVGVSYDDEPSRCVAENSLRNTRAFTIPAAVFKGPPRAWLEQGRVVSMTARALARFQTFPDTYQFPTGKGANRVSCAVIGNAVPPLWVATILESVKGVCSA